MDPAVIRLLTLFLPIYFKYYCLINKGYLKIVQGFLLRKHSQDQGHGLWLLAQDHNLQIIFEDIEWCSTVLYTLKLITATGVAGIFKKLLKSLQLGSREDMVKGG